MKSFFGGWAKPFFVLFDSNGFGPAKTENCNRDDPEVAELFLKTGKLKLKSLNSRMQMNCPMGIYLVALGVKKVESEVW
jgi:hypothetical protein